VRKGEACERLADDFKITETRLTVDFHQRKKRGAEVPPSESPLNWYGVHKIAVVIPSLVGDWMAETGSFRPLVARIYNCT